LHKSPPFEFDLVERGSQFVLFSHDHAVRIQTVPEPVLGHLEV